MKKKNSPPVAVATGQLENPLIEKLASELRKHFPHKLACRIESSRHIEFRRIGRDGRKKLVFFNPSEKLATLCSTLGEEAATAVPAIKEIFDQERFSVKTRF